ncbi:MAG TPA: hypothetical protein VFP26_14305 [Gemmatimonadaceae bacterium]|jgi:hypothetical protein|nr:hypothetical protein [Gemmatimonadaceae bacterium]
MTVKRTTLSVVAATALLAAFAGAQEGQGGFSLGVGAGFAQADQGVGYTLLSTLEFPSPVQMLRPRADLFYSNWGRWPNVAGLTGNLLLTPFSTRKVAPYLLVGAGAYLEEDSNPKAGATLGLGLRLPGGLRSVVIESQAHVYRLESPRGTPYAISPTQGPIFDPGSAKRNRVIWKPLGLTIQF